MNDDGVRDAAQEEPPARATTVVPVGDWHRLVRRVMAGTRASFGAQARGPRALGLMAQGGYGLDVFCGEHVVAYLDHDPGGPGQAGVVITDRALVAVHKDDTAVVRLRDVLSAGVEEGLLLTSLRVTTLGGDEELPVVSDVAAVARLLSEVGALGYVPQGREAPWVTLTDDDPSGLAQLLDTLRDPDPAVVGLIRLARARMQAGRLDRDDARDLAVRLGALHRCFAYGRAMTDGGWVSPLRAEDLALLVPGIFRHPTESRRKGGRTEIDINPPRDGDAGSSAPGAAAAGVAGVAAKGAGALREQLESRMMASLLGMVVERAEKALGVELDEVLGASLEHLRVTLEDGPSTRALIAGLEEAGALDQLGSKLGALSRRWFGADLPTTSWRPLTVWRFEGLIHGRYTDLTPRRPLLTRRLSTSLLQLDIRGLTLRALRGHDLAPERAMRWEPSAVQAELSEVLDAETVALLMAEPPPPLAASGG